MTIFNGTKPLDDFIPAGGSRRAALGKSHPGMSKAELFRPAETWRPEYVHTIAAMAAMGADARKIAEALGVRFSVFERWVRERFDVQRALAGAVARADFNVVHSLYLRACGYTHDSEKIFLIDEVEERVGEDGETVTVKTKKPLRVPFIEHYPPDTQAASKWLDNRLPDQWRSKIEHEHSGMVRIAKDMTDEELIAIAAVGSIVDNTEPSDGVTSGGRASETTESES